jgi:hypothetical protein
VLLRSVTGRKACRQAGAHLDAARRRRRLGPRPQAATRTRRGAVARDAVAAPPEWRLGPGPTRMGPAPRPTPPKRCAFKARCASGGAGEHLTRLGVRPGRLRSLAQSPSRRPGAKRRKADPRAQAPARPGCCRPTRDRLRAFAPASLLRNRRRAAALAAARAARRGRGP